MAHMNMSHRQRGQALIELLVALGIFGILAAAVTGLAIDALWSLQTGTDLTGAVAYAQEGLEASRQIADRSWTALALGDHGVTVETVGPETRYAFAGTSDIRGIYNRTVRISEVYRDASGNVVTQGGTIDPDTRRATSTVTWATGVTRRSQSVSFTTFLANWESFSWTETLQAQFRQGTLASTQVIAAPEPPVDNGSVRLAGAVDWSAPVVRGTFDAAGSGDARAVIVRSGYAYLVTDDGGDGRLLVVDVSDVTAPALAGSVSLGSPAAGVAVSGGYAYVALASTSRELGVVDVRNVAAPSFVRAVDVPGAAAGRSVAVEGSLLLLGRDGSALANEIVAFTVSGSDPSSPVLAGSLPLAGDPSVTSVALRSGTAFLATTGDSTELTIVNASNPSSLNLQGTLDLSGNADATGAAVSGLRAYLTRAGDNEFVVVDITNLSAPSSLGSLDLGNGANGVAAEGGFAYIAARAQGNEFQRVDAGTPTSLSVAGAAAVGAEPQGIAFVGNYAYLATAGNDRELTIIGGGEGGWANPTRLGGVDLPGGKPLLAVAVAGDFAYVGRQKAESAGEFAVINVQEPRAPTLSSQFEVNDNVNDVFVSGHRAFLATDRNDKELVVVDVANPQGALDIGSFNAPGNSDGLGVFVTGNLAILATRSNSGGAEVFLLDITNPGSPVLRGSIDLTGNPDVNTVTGTSTTLFFATTDSTRDVQAYSIANPAAPAFLGSYNTAGAGNAVSLVLRGTELYVGTRNNGGGNPEFFILDVSVPSTLQLVSSGSAFDVGSDVLGLDVSGTVGFVGTNSGDQEFQTLNLNNLNSPSRLGTAEIDAPVNDVAVGGTYAYLATAEDDDEGEFQIFKSADAAGFATSGTYDSIAFDSGAASTVWEGLNWNAILNGGTVRFQLRRGATQAALESTLFVGPDGTVNTYYEVSPSALTLPNSTDPLPGQWMQWRGYVNGTQAATPELQDVTLTFRR